MRAAILATCVATFGVVQIAHADTLTERKSTADGNHQTNSQLSETMTETQLEIPVTSYSDLEDQDISTRLRTTYSYEGKRQEGKMTNSVKSGSTSHKEHTFSDLSIQDQTAHKRKSSNYHGQESYKHRLGDSTVNGQNIDTVMRSGYGSPRSTYTYKRQKSHKPRLVNMGEDKTMNIASQSNYSHGQQNQYILTTSDSDHSTATRPQKTYFHREETQVYGHDLQNKRRHHISGSPYQTSPKTSAINVQDQRQSAQRGMQTHPELYLPVIPTQTESATCTCTKAIGDEQIIVQFQSGDIDEYFITETDKMSEMEKNTHPTFYKHPSQLQGVVTIEKDFYSKIHKPPSLYGEVTIDKDVQTKYHQQPKVYIKQIEGETGKKDKTSVCAIIPKGEQGGKNVVVLGNLSGEEEDILQTGIEREHSRYYINTRGHTNIIANDFHRVVDNSKIENKGGIFEMETIIPYKKTSIIQDDNVCKKVRKDITIVQGDTKKDEVVTEKMIEYHHQHPSVVDLFSINDQVSEETLVTQGSTVIESQQPLQKTSVLSGQTDQCIGEVDIYKKKQTKLCDHSNLHHAVVMEKVHGQCKEEESGVAKTNEQGIQVIKKENQKVDDVEFIKKKGISDVMAMKEGSSGVKTEGTQAVAIKEGKDGVLVITEETVGELLTLLEEGKDKLLLTEEDGNTLTRSSTIADKVISIEKDETDNQVIIEQESADKIVMIKEKKTGNIVIEEEQTGDIIMTNKESHNIVVIKEKKTGDNKVTDEKTGNDDVIKKEEGSNTIIEDKYAGEEDVINKESGNVVVKEDRSIGDMLLKQDKQTESTIIKETVKGNDNNMRSIIKEPSILIGGSIYGDKIETYKKLDILKEKVSNPALNTSTLKLGNGTIPQYHLQHDTIHVPHKQYPFTDENVYNIGMITDLCQVSISDEKSKFWGKDDISAVYTESYYTKPGDIKTKYEHTENIPKFYIQEDKHRHGVMLTEVGTPFINPIYVQDILMNREETQAKEIIDVIHEDYSEDKVYLSGTYSALGGNVQESRSWPQAPFSPDGQVRSCTFAEPGGSKVTQRRKLLPKKLPHYVNTNYQPSKGLTYDAEYQPTIKSDSHSIVPFESHYSQLGTYKTSESKPLYFEDSELPSNEHIGTVKGMHKQEYLSDYSPEYFETPKINTNTHDSSDRTEKYYIYSDQDDFKYNTQDNHHNSQYYIDSEQYHVKSSNRGREHISQMKTNPKAKRNRNQETFHILQYQTPKALWDSEDITVTPQFTMIPTHSFCRDYQDTPSESKTAIRAYRTVAPGHYRHLTFNNYKGNPYRFQ